MIQPPLTNSNQSIGMRRQFIAHQQTLPQQVPLTPSPSLTLSGSGVPSTQPPHPVVPPLSASVPRKKRNVSRIIAAIFVLGLATALYFIWQTASPTTTTAPSNSSNVSQQNFSAVGTSAPTTDGIRVYVVGAVKNPGIYTLASGARVYDLLQAAGGPLPNANLVAINLAAKLSDGQEVYITQVGETPPTYSGGVPGTGENTNSQLININTASIDALYHGLHISKKSAQAIIDYRTQHGDYTSVDQLAQVVSNTVYAKIKALCTV